MQMNEWWRGCLRGVLPLVPVLAVGFAIPAYAGEDTGCPGPSSCVTVDPAGLADTAEPGSVLVFPKFAQGSAVLDNGAVEPKTQIEIGAVCEKNTNTGGAASPANCLHFADIAVEVHWVCPGAAQGQQNSVCLENDFVVHVSTFGKVVFNPGVGAGNPPITPNGRVTGYPKIGGTTAVPNSLCQRGYALAFVINNASNPVGMNVLIGDSVQRNDAAGKDLQSYSALAIQAVTTNPGGIPPTIDLGGDPDGPPASQLASLPFTGQPNQYQMVTGQFWGDVRFSQNDKAPFADTQLILLTLDVRSNLQNSTTHVFMDFYNQNEIPISESWSFDCWDQVQLDTIDTGGNLEASSQGTPVGLIVTGTATDAKDGRFRTLLGLIQVQEGPTAAGAPTRSYTVRPSNNSIPVPTYFVFD